MNLCIDSNYDFFSKLISCSQNLYYWCYDASLRPLFHTSPNVQALDTLFTLDGCKEYLSSYMQEQRMPLVLNNSLGLVWIAALEHMEDDIKRAHIIGPVFLTDISVRNLEITMKNLRLSDTVRKEFLPLLLELPIINMTTFYHYALMLQYCITREKITVSDICYQKRVDSLSLQQKPIPSGIQITKSHGTYLVEQAMMRAVEEGNLNYMSVFNKLAITGTLGQFSTGDLIRQNKDFAIVFIALCSRASMRGGLSPEIAYTLSDYYFQGIENATTLSELAEINHTMCRDFITRVHNYKLNTGISREVRGLCDYIHLHITEELSLGDISFQLGYTEYYLSRKFKKEIGCSVSSYINKAKIEQAKLMILSTSKNIQEISDILHFCSPSYFSVIFRDIVGTSPVDFRSRCGQTDFCLSTKLSKE